MPELAEVAYACSKWNPGINKKIVGVIIQPDSRVYRKFDSKKFENFLLGKTLLASECHGKQMLFTFSEMIFLGIHLGMTGDLELKPKNYQKEKHDAIVIQQAKHCLVFRDPRQFGRLRIHSGKTHPNWWTNLSPSVIEKNFTAEILHTATVKHRKKLLKALLLDQRYFPGLGNWMVDEILWRAKLKPSRLSGTLTKLEIKKLFKQIKFVAKGAMNSVGIFGGDPPKNWLFHRRWKDGQLCPKTKTPLLRENIGGRTTCWAPTLQK